MSTRYGSRWVRFGVIAAAIASFDLASCVAPVGFDAAEESLVEPPVTSRRLTVSGQRLLDSLGREVILRGFNVGGRAKMPPYLPFDLNAGETTAAAANDFFGRLSALGANVVRLTFSWEAYEPTRGTYDAAYMARYRTLLDAAHACGLAVIVDFHQDVFASPFYGDGFPLWALGDIPHGEPRYDSSFPFWSLPALIPGTRVSEAFDRLWDNEDGIQDAMELMWRSVASQLVSHPAVAAFEVVNEPAGANRENAEMDGTILPAFYERMGHAIQEAAGTEVPVFWDSRINTTGVPADLVPPDVPSAVYAPHYYEPFIMLGFPFVLTDTIRSDLQATFSTRATWDMPVFLGEYGVPSSNSAKAAFLDTLLDTLDTLRGHGTMWDASASSTYWNGENFSVLNPNRSEASWAGAVVRPYPRAIAGRITSFSWDATARRFVLDVSQATTGTSVVYLPSRHLGNAPIVGVTGATYTYVASTQTLLLEAPAGGTYHVVVTRNNVVCSPTQYLSNGSCVSLTNCTTGQYESIAPTASSNRVCSACAPACTNGQYQATACANGNAPQNRVCVACTPVSQCASAITCTNAASSQCTGCNAGYALVNNAPPTADLCTSPSCDATCATCNGPSASQCTSCQPGRYLAGTTCVPWTSCTTGQYQEYPPTTTTDRVCAPCTTCAPGQTEVIPCANGNSTQNRACSTSTCNPSAALDVAAGQRHGCAVFANGQLWCWGNNGNGQLGQGNSNQYTVPVRVGTASDWQQIAVGWNHSCGIRAGGTLYCWGADGNGQLGRQGADHMPGVVGTGGYTSISTGSRTTCAGRALCGNANVQCWGANNKGQVGIGNTDDQQAPATINGFSFCGFAAGGDNDNGHSIFIQGTSLYYAGIVFGRAQAKTPALYGTSGLWGTGDRVAAGGTHSCAIHNGRLYCAGNNGSGQLGTGNTTAQASLVAIGTATDWSFVSAGELHTCGIRAGNLFCWGENDTHQAGNAGASDYTSPQAIGSAGGWTDVAGGVDHTCAIRAGDIYCWGANNERQLGIGTAQTSPVSPVCLP